MRAYQTARRKEIYEALHPETKASSFHGNRHTGSRRQIGEGQSDRFTAATSKIAGRSERTVQREAERGEKLGSTLNRIAGTSLDKGVEIDALAALPPQEREDIVARAVKGEKVSARKLEGKCENVSLSRAAGETVAPLDTDSLRAKTIARRIMRLYLEAPRDAQREFDDLHAEIKSDAGRASEGA